MLVFVFFFFKQEEAFEVRISDWRSDLCFSDLVESMLDRRTRWPTPVSPFRKSSRRVLRPSKHGDDCFVAFEPVRGIRVHRVWTRRTEARQRITTAPCRRRQLPFG